MWDSNAPLQLLKSMPKKLSKDNLEKIQLVIDADKYKNSLISGFDLCGMYAPFCRGCSKTSIYPCAIAYVNMMRAQGMDIEIDARPVSGADSRIFTQKPIKEELPVAEDKPQERNEEEIAVTSAVEENSAVNEVVEQPSVQENVTGEEPASEEKSVKEENNDKNEPSEKTVKRKIRIAVARKKI